MLLKDLDGAELSAHAAAALGHLHARAASRLKEILVEKGLIY